MRITNGPASFDEFPVYDKLVFRLAHRRYDEMFRDILLVSQYDVHMLGGWNKNNMVDMTIAYDSVTLDANAMAEVEIYLKHPVWQCIALIGKAYQWILDDILHGNPSLYPTLVDTVINLDKNHILEQYEWYY